MKPGSAGVPMPGYDLRIVDDQCKELPAGTMGSIVVKLPLPPSCLPTLWQQDERFKESYLTEFPGHYKTADAGFKDDDGFVYVMGRTDDIINVAGHRLSTGGMEEVLAAHQDVAECAVVGIADALKGEVPCGFVVLKAGVNRPPAEIEQECCRSDPREDRPGGLRSRLRSWSARLPKTRSGKILRGTMKKIADGEALDHAGDHRRSGDPRRDRRRAERQGRRGSRIRGGLADGGSFLPDRAMGGPSSPRNMPATAGPRCDAVHIKRPTVRCWRTKTVVSAALRTTCLRCRTGGAAMGHA